MGWVDLTSWSGKMVEIAFSLKQPTAAPVATARIYHLTMDAWNTPLIDTIQPMEVPGDKDATIEISGENFAKETKAYLDDRATQANAADRIEVETIWVSPQQLILTVPQKLHPGRYAVTLLNTDGTMYTFPESIAVGTFNFLPSIFR